MTWKTAEIIQSEEQKKRKNEESQRDLWNTVRNNNIYITGIPGEDKGTESIFKTIMAENVSSLGREMDIQIHETQRIPNRLNPNTSTLTHTIKLLKVKDKQF